MQYTIGQHDGGWYVLGTDSNLSTNFLHGDIWRNRLRRPSWPQTGIYESFAGAVAALVKAVGERGSNDNRRD